MYVSTCSGTYNFCIATTHHGRRTTLLDAVIPLPPPVLVCATPLKHDYLELPRTACHALVSRGGSDVIA